MLIGIWNDSAAKGPRTFGVSPCLSLDVSWGFSTTILKTGAYCLFLKQYGTPHLETEMAARAESRGKAVLGILC